MPISKSLVVFFSLILFLFLSGCEKKKEIATLGDPQEFLREKHIFIPPEKEFVPDFQYLDLDGKIHHFSELKGKMVFLNFWATWCPPCRYEMPDMEELHFKLKDSKFQILAINVAESKETVDNFLKNSPYSFPIGLDEEKSISNQLRVNGLPTTLFVGTEGEILGLAVGPRKWSDPRFSQYFEKMANQSH